MAKERYPFDLEVLVFTRPHLRDEGLDMEQYIGRRVLDACFDRLEEFDDEEVVFSFPERWLNIIEQRRLYDRLAKYGRNLKKVQIKTHSVYIIQCTHNEDVFMVKDGRQLDDRGDGHLYDAEATGFGRIINPDGMTVFGGTIVSP